MKFLMRANKAVMLLVIGGATYAIIEIIWRGYTHWTMAILGGFMFLLLGGLNEWFPWEMPLALQSIIGALLVTASEFFTGLILNRWLGLGIWDYSAIPGNILGQICPQFVFAWMGLALVAILVDDWLRYWLWAEPRPHYTFFKKGHHKMNISYKSSENTDIYSSSDAPVQS